MQSPRPPTCQCNFALNAIGAIAIPGLSYLTEETGRSVKALGTFGVTDETGYRYQRASSFEKQKPGSEKRDNKARRADR